MSRPTSSNSLTITGTEELSKLLSIPETVKVVILSGDKDSEITIEFPELPSHVDSLTIHRARILGKPQVKEGLVMLDLGDCTYEHSLSHWIFPSSLEHFKIKDPIEAGVAGVVDLRSVTAPEISVDNIGSGNLRLYGNLPLIFPEGLESLNLDGGFGFEEKFVTFVPPGTPLERRTDDEGNGLVLIALPHYLRTMTLRRIDKVIPGELSLTADIEELTIMGESQFRNIHEIFPRLDTLTLAGLTFHGRGYMSEPEEFAYRGNLKHLIMRRVNVSSRGTILFSIQGAETVTITDAYKGILYQPMDGPKTLIVKDSESFPSFESLANLETLVTRGTRNTLELPFAPMLKALDLDAPAYSNKVRVSNLDEYRATWEA